MAVVIVPWWRTSTVSVCGVYLMDLGVELTLSFTCFWVCSGVDGAVLYASFLF